MNPGMTMLAGGVDHLGVPDLERGADGDDAVVLDQDVAVVDVADLGIHAQHMAAMKQHASGHGPPFWFS